MNDYRWNVLAATVTVTYPTTGAIFVKNGTYDITWTTTGTVKPGVKIELWKSGSFLRQLILETPSGSPYSWTVPTNLVDGTDYTIMIMGCELVATSCVSLPVGFSPPFQITSSCPMPNCDFTTTWI